MKIIGLIIPVLLVILLSFYMPAGTALDEEGKELPLDFGMQYFDNVKVSKLGIESNKYTDSVPTKVDPPDVTLYPPYEQSIYNKDTNKFIARGPTNRVLAPTAGYIVAIDGMFENGKTATTLVGTTIHILSPNSTIVKLQLGSDLTMVADKVELTVGETVTTTTVLGYADDCVMEALYFTKSQLLPNGENTESILIALRGGEIETISGAIPDKVLTTSEERNTYNRQEGQNGTIPAN